MLINTYSVIGDGGSTEMTSSGVERQGEKLERLVNRTPGALFVLL